MGNRLDSLDEGVEFGYQKNGGEWIPLAWYSSRNNRDNQNRIRVGELIGNNLTIRGYSVPFYHVNTSNVQLKLCGSEIIQDNTSLSFRWLQTVISVLNPNVDDISVDDVHISINSSALQQNIVLFEDDFNNQSNIRYVVSIACIYNVHLLESYNYAAPVNGLMFVVCH